MADVGEEMSGMGSEEYVTPTESRKRRRRLRSASEGSPVEGEIEGILSERAGVINKEIEDKLDELVKYFESNFSKEKHGAFVNARIEGIRKCERELNRQVIKIGKVLEVGFGG